MVIGLTTFAYRYEGLRREDFDEVLGVPTRRGGAVAMETIRSDYDVQRYMKILSNEYMHSWWYRPQYVDADDTDGYISKSYLKL